MVSLGELSVFDKGVVVVHSFEMNRAAPEESRGGPPTNYSDAGCGDLVPNDPLPAH
jgi:hypothetical protein